MSGGEAPSERAVRRCRECGAEVRFSHREYAGRGAQMAVFRCTRCGVTDSAPVPRDAPVARGRSRRKAPIDEGPPENPVLDAETVKRLLGG
ncbi:MAG TPA: hypothetical protein VFA70_12615 [Dehalococcoidia bacterium]|nr:hypothetical protein [Dehalococcoidia bacterium]